MNIVLTPSALAEVVKAYSEVDAFAWDVETMDLSPKPDGFEDMPAKEQAQYDRRADPRRNQIVWVGLATYGRADVIPMGHPNGDLLRVDRPLLATGKTRQAKGLPLRDNDYSRDQKKWINVFDAPPEQLTPAEVWDALAPLFHREGVTKVAHNLTFDAQSSVKYLGGLPARPYHCTRTAEFVLDSRNKNATGLDDVVARRFEYRMEKGVGARIEKYSFMDVARYLFRDVRYTWLLYRVQKPRLIADKAKTAFNLDMDVQEVICKMEMAGALVDEEALEILRDSVEYDLEKTKALIYAAAGRAFNINSNPEKQALLWGPKPNGRGLKARILTPGGKKKRAERIPLTVNDYAVSEEALKVFEGQDEIIDLLLEYAELNKLMTTYVTPYLGGEVVRTTGGKQRIENRVSLLNNGRVHTTFSLISADTGRFSCVSGETLLTTNRGTFRFDEYLPLEGDRVFTHAGRWMPVLRKIYKGTAPMFRVVLENGATLHCTADHRLLTLSGWSRLGDLTEGDVVASYVGIEEVSRRLGESASSGHCVSCSGQAYGAAGSAAVGDHVSQCAGCTESGPNTAAIEGRAVSSLLTLENGCGEPYAGQEWFPAPQLCRPCRERGWVFTAENPGEVCPGTPKGDGGSAGFEVFASALGRASHRPGQTEQRVGQPGAGNEVRARTTSQFSSRIASITSVGTMGVWDIEVEGDHSYLAHGFVNHNSKDPNLQNIPNPRSHLGKQVRNAFIAPDGYRLVVADYSQIEPRVIASLADDPVMIASYLNGEDIYTTIGSPFGVDRAGGKVLVLSLSYGVGPEKVAKSLGVSVDRAKQILRDFERHFPAVMEYKKKIIRDARARKPVPYVTTIMGRRRYLPDLALDGQENYGFRSRAERQAFNTRIQGSAADIIKLAMIRADRMIPNGAYLSLTVHDEIVTVTPEDRADVTAEAIRQAMEGVNLSSMKVPLLADVKVVRAWGDAK